MKDKEEYQIVGIMPLFGHKAASERGEIRGFMLEIKKIFW